MDSFNLIELTDRFLERDRTVTEERLPHMYPSEARCICENTGKVLGNCLRSSYYRLTGIEQTNPPNARFHYIFMLGNLVEEFLVNRWKEMGIWLDGNVPFSDIDHGYIVSGKIDAFIRNWTQRTQIIGVEVKSFYGYHATREIIGSTNQEGRPKIDQLLQTLYYAERYRDRGVPGFKMAYLARDSVERRELGQPLMARYTLTSQSKVLEAATVFSIRLYGKILYLVEISKRCIQTMRLKLNTLLERYRTQPTINGHATVGVTH